MKDILISFGLPAMVLIMCFVLLICGHDGEVKAIMAMAAGWIFKSGYARRQHPPTNNDALRLKSTGLEEKINGTVPSGR